MKKYVQYVDSITSSVGQNKQESNSVLYVVATFQFSSTFCNVVSFYLSIFIAF